MWQVEDLSSNDWSLGDYTWRGGGCLKVWHYGDSHSLWHFWDESHTEFRGWYVNLEDPWSETRLGWDTRDLALDLVVEPDGCWRWKDEDHLATALEQGLDYAHTGERDPR